jgi:hypothetical protein
MEVPLDQLRDQDVVELITATWLDGAQKKSLLIAEVNRERLIIGLRD